MILRRKKKMFLTVAVTCLTLIIVTYFYTPSTFYHKAVGLDDDNVLSLAEKTEDLSVFKEAFDAVAVPRVVGTVGHDNVQKYIETKMKNLGWEITRDAFTAATPVGTMPFTNIIATHNPGAKRFLDFACHYDSKFFKEFVFIAATDSAAPCAMMIQMGSNLNGLLNKFKQPEISLRFIFFDGEEAFQEWTSYDSLYGARHLAEKWEKTPYPEGGKDANQLDRMEMLVLLDLLGASDPKFYNFFSVTQNWYKLLANAEDKLKRNRKLKGKEGRYLQLMSTSQSIEDDHIPFLHRDVPILHMIPLPFPKEWHKASDTKDIVRIEVVADLVNIFSIFICEYLHLNN